MDNPTFNVDYETEKALDNLIDVRKHELRECIQQWITTNQSDLAFDRMVKDVAFDRMVKAFDRYKFAVRVKQEVMEDGLPF